MPRAYVAVRDKFVRQGVPLAKAKSRASAIFISRGKSKAARSRRAKLLHSD